MSGISERRGTNGIVVIITNNYETVRQLETLAGTGVDGDNLSCAFNALNFHVIWKQNISRVELHQTVYDITQINYQTYPCIIFIFAGHGCEGDKLYMEDGAEVSICKDILEPLLPKRSQHLGNVPKAFLIDACRGKERTETVLVPRSPVVEKTSPRGGELIDMKQVPAAGNFLLAYSTMPNHKAYEKRGQGGIWFSTLVKLIQRRECLHSLEDLLTKVNKSMTEDLLGPDVQQPEKLSRLNDVICLAPQDPQASVSTGCSRKIAAVFPSANNTITPQQQPGTLSVHVLARYTKQYGLRVEYIDKEIYSEEYQRKYYSSAVKVVGAHCGFLLECHSTNMYVSLDEAREEAAKIAYQSLLKQPPTGQNVLPSSSNVRAEARTDGQSVRQLDMSKSLAPEPFKNSRDRLNHYFQKNGLNPRYDYVEDYSSGQPIFKCTIQYSVNGKIIRRDSGRFFPRKDDAKENAARNVLQNMEADTQPRGGSGGAGATVGVSWKSLLKEHYDKRGHPNMVLNYDTMPSGSGFLSEVFVPELRRKVKGEIGRSKKEAEQSAAKKALQLLKAI